MAAVELDLRDQGRPTYPKEKSDADTILGSPGVSASTPPKCLAWLGLDAAAVAGLRQGAGVKDPAGRPQPPQMMPS